MSPALAAAFFLAVVQAGAVDFDGRGGGKAWPSAAEVPAVTDVRVLSRAARGTLVLIQIDGLSFDRLVEAIGRGKVPSMSGLLNAGFKISPFRCGVPTVTQSVQSQIFHGIKLPGNDWYSKKGAAGAGRAFIEGVDFERSLTRPGLLGGGRVYLSELAGGAKDGVDVSSFIRGDTEASGGTLAYLRNFWKGDPWGLLVRFPSIRGEARAMEKAFRRNGFNTELDRKAPMFISLLENYCSEVSEEGLKAAIRDGVPVVYTDFSAYDEKAHYFGGSSDRAFDALERLDGRVGRIAAVAGANGARLFVFSDHGQTPSEVFSRRFGKTMQRLVDELARRATPAYHAGDLVFAHVYSMGNIYLRGHDGLADQAVIERFYPGFLDALAAHEGVGVLAVRSGSEVRLWSKVGKAAIRGGRLAVTEGSSPLAAYLDSRMSEAQLADQVEDYMRLPESGDVVVFAPYAGGRTIDYNDKYTLISEHGGIGGEQMHPFILYDPAVMPEAPLSWRDARDLGRVFSALKASGAAAAGPARP